MTGNFGSLLFTEAVQQLQQRYGSRKHYARTEVSGVSPVELGPMEIDHIENCDNCYIASIGAKQWPYVQHRGGPKGFLRVLDSQTIGFADFRGNGQFVTVGNIVTNPRVSLILVDYPSQSRLKLLGTAEVLEGELAHPYLERVHPGDYKAIIQRVVLIHLEGFDWNCTQHIIPRFTVEQLRSVLGPVEKRIQELEETNQQLLRQLSSAASGNPGRG